jgi:hypothetical protein
LDCDRSISHLLSSWDYRHELPQHQWLTLVILAVLEAEIRKIKVQGQPWANSL